jgi:quercetin dioxygenase-like cupin family protein
VHTRDSEAVMVRVGASMVNPRTGQTMFFRQTTRDTKGELFQSESFNEPHGPAEPEHIHPLQESSCEVLSGVLTFRIDGVEQVLRAGDKVTIPVGVPHYFWNSGDEVAHHVGEFRPALRTQQFFETWFGLARDGKLDERGMPSLLQLAVMVPAFGDEMRPTSPPWPLLRAISWLLGPIARLRGYRSVYPQYGAASPDAATT